MPDWPLSTDRPTALLARWVGHTRYVVVLAALAVLLVAVAPFLLGSWLAVVGVWHAFRDAFAGELDATSSDRST